jgi:hydroxymethylpyrimidine/phosphomethylpyrimidine kinase
MTDTRITNVLSIAGSDPSGGAGIQADIKAISANGCYAMAAITALTAQNTRGVSAERLLDPAFVAEQIDGVFRDIQVDSVKIGMLGDAAITVAVAEALLRQRDRNPPRHVVLDPVMVAKGGDRLLAEAAVTALRERLLPLATVLTPNLPEAAALLGLPEPKTRDAMAEMATALRSLGPANGSGAVLLKGGHLPGPESPDLLATADGEHWFEAERLPTRNTHGTGCTLASALAARLAVTGDIRTAVEQAKAYIDGAIAAAERLDVGEGHGPTHHFYALWR